MNNWTIGRRISTGFTLVLIITIGLGAFCLFRSVGLKTNILDLGENIMPSIELQSKWIAEIDTKMICVQQLNDTLSAERRAEIMKRLHESTENAAKFIKQYEPMIVSDKDRACWVDAGKTNEELTVAIAKTIELLAAAQQSEPAKAELSHYLQTVLDPTYEKASKAADAGIEYNIELGNEHTKAGHENADSTILLIMIVTGAVTLVAVLITWQITSTTNKALRGLAADLDRGSLQTASAARQVSMASNQLSSGSSEQASSVEETSSSLEEMSSMIRATADNAQKAKSLASDARKEAETGSNIMGEMMDAMKAIDSSSAEVAKIVKNIDEIAFQTNILALNAAVEAARAGEAGAGFAVVADEVRSLAQRSAAAAKETADKIEAAIANSRSGSACSSKVGESLKHIAEKVSATDALVADIATAATEQSQGIQQINNAMSQMDKVTQGNAASAEESASAAEELDAQAETMKDLVAKLRGLVGGSSTTSSEPSPKSRTQAAPRASHAPTRSSGSRSIPMPDDSSSLSASNDDFRNF